MLAVKISTLLFVSLTLSFSTADVVSDVILPFIARPVNVFNTILTQSPVVRGISDFSGDVIAAGGRAVSYLPIAVTRLIGINGKLPTLLDSNIDSEFQENFLQQFNAGKDNEDAHLHITELVTKYGYPIEQHTIQTGDGYILTLYRIQKEDNNGTSPAVLLMHGMLGSSDDWVIAGPDHSLAYILVDNGYDVWLGNARGNTHSRRHTTDPPTSSRFWDFSWHEMGTQDLPATVDHILKTTGRKSLKYVGHSQGTTAFFVMCSELPEYNEKVDLMVALSPVAWMTNVGSPFVRLAAPVGDLIHFVLKSIGANEFLPNHTILKTLGELLCAGNALSQILCSNVLFLTCGFSLEQLNSTALPVILGHVPAGAATRQLLHYGQGVISTDFRQFDFGPQKNNEKYGSEVPPSYKLEQITVPVSLVHSEKDWLASPEDVAQLSGRLANVVETYLVPRAQFNHIDFLWGLEAKELVFDKILETMGKYGNNE